MIRQMMPLDAQLRLRRDAMSAAAMRPLHCRIRHTHASEAYAILPPHDLFTLRHTYMIIF